MPRQTFEGGAIAYTDEGTGPTLVLLHAFPVDSQMWEAQVKDLSSRCRVIAPDFRGFGGSQPPGPFTIPSLADDIHSMLVALKVLPCVVGGLSMGGYVALSYVRKYPTDLRGLVLMDTKADADNSEQIVNRNKMIEIARTQGSKAIADTMLGKMLSPDTIDHRPDVVNRLRAIMESCPPLAIQYALAALRDRPDMTAELPSIPAPTLVIVGDADTLTPPSVAESMAKQIPRAKLALVRGAGHMSAMEQPAQINHALRQFIGEIG
ncbi:MAG: alpha/beta hydrolase [Phycisphaerales bacterium]|nr:alpha/beta hydrolase [Phycisphaerales bacterium]MDB5356365.1 alpha/beta hydrolase [Phycisphaerales bacterium]